jgi:ABC-type branched-subunit amino acid transport system substrate-binding protein
MRTPRSCKVAAVAVAVGLVLAGCGSRVDEDVAESAPAGVTTDLGAPQTATGAGTTGAVTGGTTATQPGTTTTTGAGATATGTTPATTTTGTTPAGTTGTKSSGTKPAANVPVAQGCAKQGPPVTIGQVGTFSGLVGANFAGAIKTSYVWVNYMNQHGGLGCHPIRFIQIDDQSNPALSQAAVERLATKEGAIAIFAAFVPLDIAGFQAGLNKMKIAAIGGDQAAPEWNSNPYMYPVGGTPRAAIAGSVQQAAEAGGKKIAVLYCVEASPCGSNFNDTIIKDGFAKKFGMEVVYSGSISITQPDYTAQCQNAKSAGADVVAWGLDRAGLQRAAKSCAAIGYFPKLPLIALQGSFDPKDPNLRKSTAFLSGLSFPYMVDNTPATKLYHDAMRQFAPGAAIDTAGSGTWAAGQMLAKIVEKLGPEAQTRALTKEDIFTGAGKIKNETLDGIIPATTYRATGPQPENLCYFGIAFGSDGIFRAPKGLKPTCL